MRAGNEAAARAAARRRGKIEGTSSAALDPERPDDGLNQYISRACELPLLPRDEQRRLLARARAGDRAARERLVLHNMRLVVFVAKKFRGRGVAYSDLVQEGSIGLARAVDKWDPERGALSTVATWWIRKSIQTAIYTTGDSIRVPSHVIDRRSAAIKFLRAHPEATRADIAVALEIDVEQVELALGVAEVVASLDNEVNGDGDGYAESLANMLADPLADDPADVVLREDPAVRAALDRLDPEQRRIIELRYGIAGGLGPLSFPEIGVAVNLPRDQVSKRHAQAMLKLRRILTEPGMMVTDVGEVNEGRAGLMRGLLEPSTSDTAPPDPGPPPLPTPTDADDPEGEDE